jgi:hypothetical protein
MAFTQKDVDRAREGLNKHYDFVDRRLSSYCFEPTETYDIIRPEVWKGQHWVWFLLKYGK